MAVVLNFPLHTFFHNVFEGIKKRQNEIAKKKIEFLYKEAYRYFLDLYIMKVQKHGLIDLPEFMYRSGAVICGEARTNAEQVMLDVIAHGDIDKCYTKRMNELKKIG